MKKVLITGVTGFAGSFLAEELTKHDQCEIYGTSHSDSGLSNISSIQDKLHIVKIDLTDSQAVIKMISDLRPDEIYHLAALPSPAESFKDPKRFLHDNVDIELNILEAVRKNDLPGTKILVVSSADIYGRVREEDLPIAEGALFHPINPYAVSKVTQDVLAYQYFIAHNMHIIRVRPFNHIGPRQSDSFVVSSFSKKIVEIEKGKRKPVVLVGNLESKRDFTDVRDIVRGYRLAMEKGSVGEVYNLGYGKSVVIKDILHKLLRLSTVEDIKVETDPALLRPSDIPNIVCDNTKARCELEWMPRIFLERTLKDTLEYWREQI